MSNDFSEVALSNHVYLRMAGRERTLYSLRPVNCLSTFPISGGSYFGNELENPKDDLVELLSAQAASYQGLQVVIDSVYHPDLVYNEYSDKAVLDRVITRSKQLFFKDQMDRLTLVGQTLRETVKKAEFGAVDLSKFPGHYVPFDFSTMYNAVVSLHRKVQSAQSSFDKLVIGTNVTAQDKYGEEPYVLPPLELATDRLLYLSKNPEGKEMFEKARKENLLNKVQYAKETSENIRKSLL